MRPHHVVFTDINLKYKNPESLMIRSGLKNNDADQGMNLEWLHNFKT